jgi:hypothetical protein
MLQAFYLDVAYVLQLFLSIFQVFLQVFQTHVLNVSFVFKRMLQVLYLDVSKVDWVLQLPSRFQLPRLGVSSSPSAALHPSQTEEGRRRGCARAGGQDTPGDCGANTSTRYPFLLHGQVALQSPLVFYIYAGY